MKAAIVSVLLAASVTQAALIAPKHEMINWNYEQKRQALGALTSLMGLYSPVL